MADAAANKKEKLAAARKKLKQYQQKKTGNTPNSSPASTGTNTPKRATSGVNGAAKPNGSSKSQEVKDKHDSSITKSGIASPSEKNDVSIYSTPRGKPLDSSQSMSASTERLQQLSRQLNGLLSQSDAFLNTEEVGSESNGVDDLEARNRELASLLEQHNQVNQQLNKQMNELKSHNFKLQQTLDGDRKSFEEKLKRELGALKEQLQVHIQTIGILVAEKTELQSSLNQSHKLAEQRLEETEELSGRLKASRQRVAELEKSYTNASSSSNKHEQSKKEYSKEIDRLKLDIYKANKASEDYQQQNSELQGKLRQKVSECAKLEDSLIEVKGKLEMTELYVQQNGSDTPGNSEQIETLLTKQGELQGTISQYEEAFQQLTQERDQITLQYQEYIEGLNQQMQQLQQQVGILMEEREKLIDKQSELETVIKELNEKSKEVDSFASQEVLVENEKLKEMMEQYKKDFEDLAKKFQSQVTDNSQLSRLIEEKEMKLMEFEMSVQQLKDNNVDKEKLLENLQSDKTALSRAMAQNKELKARLEEIQDEFVRSKNSNMELTTQLQSEQHISQEVASRLVQQEEELKHIREELEHKERRLQELSQEDHKGVYTNDQIEDRLRHYEAQARLVETLQTELNSAQDTVNTLTNQNSLLKSQVIQGENRDNNNEKNNRDTGVIEAMNSSIRQLEMERNQIIEQCKEESREKESLQNQLHDFKQALATQTPATLNGDVVNKAQFEALQHAMKQLEEKYTKAMRDKADLSDTTERLEHTITQLSGETDTIGEYVTLYQQQRELLKQRHSEKEEYISRLSRERGELHDKLAQLQALVMQLLGERQMLHSYHENRESVSSPMYAEQLSALTQAATLAAPQTKKHRRFGGTLDSSELEDWPDYNSSQSETSDTSEVEVLVGTSNDKDRTESEQNNMNNGQNLPNFDKPDEAQGSIENSENIPNDSTAQRIMHLLTEIGHSNLVERVPYEDSFLHCINCTGQIMTL